MRSCSAIFKPMRRLYDPLARKGGTSKHTPDGTLCLAYQAAKVQVPFHHTEMARPAQAPGALAKSFGLAKAFCQRGRGLRRARHFCMMKWNLDFSCLIS